MIEPRTTTGQKARFPLVAVVVLGGLLLWSYWPSFGEMTSKWRNDPEYTHGFLVPLFALLLLYLRKDRWKTAGFQGSWWGLTLVLIGCGMRLAGMRLFVDWIEAVSLIPTLLGLVWLVGGKNAALWAWPSIAFLIFMIPLPYAVEVKFAVVCKPSTPIGAPTFCKLWATQTLLKAPTFASTIKS
jgi:hypothetical protein